MKRPSYHSACEWIAMNDNSGNNDNAEQIEAYISVQMVSDIWGIPAAQVANAVVQTRCQIGIPVSGLRRRLAHVPAQP